MRTSLVATLTTAALCVVLPSRLSAGHGGGGGGHGGGGHSGGGHASHSSTSHSAGGPTANGAACPPGHHGRGGANRHYPWGYYGGGIGDWWDLGPYGEWESWGTNRVPGRLSGPAESRAASGGPGRVLDHGAAGLIRR